VAYNRQILADWERMLRTHAEIAIRCWDHISSKPTEPIGQRYGRLRGDRAWCTYGGQQLPQWQYELDNRARVKVGLGRDFVVIMAVSTGHPRENE
jgi:hypothetical protein